MFIDNKNSLDVFLPRRAMKNVTTIKKSQNRPVERSEQAEKSTMNNLSWKEMARPMPCYFVMLISSIFQAILAVLLSPYDLLNRPQSR
jgi:hypothetical protein